MPAYEGALFAPPAPVARVTLRNEYTGATWADVPMLIDTGADVTLVPYRVVEQLGLEVGTTHFELESFDGRASLAQVVRLELLFLHRTFRGQYLLVDQEWGIVGRNILNKVSLLLDGPSLTWDEYKLMRK